MPYPVEMINNNLYTTLEGIEIGCNVDATYDSEKNTVSIFTLKYLSKYYSNKFSKSEVYGEEVPFSNQKALRYGLIIVKDEKGKYGVNNEQGQMIIGEKYKLIKFIESAKEFIIQTEDGKMGIIAILANNESKTKITPLYDSISEINDELYLVSNNGKYGIINKNNQAIVNVEYDDIGININKLAKYDLNNGYILYDDCIPVKQDKLWGFISKSTRSLIVPPTYDDIGCILGTTTENAANNVVLVPEYEGIIVKKDEKYGLINSSGKIIMKPGATEFYTTTLEGKTNYYFLFNDNRYDLIEFLEQSGIKPISKIKEEDGDKTENTETLQNLENEKVGNTEE